MPLKDTESRRKKDHDREATGASPKSPRDKDRARTVRASKSKLSSSSSLTKEEERRRDEHVVQTPSSSDSSQTPRAKKQVTMIVPEMERRRSDERKVSVYPSFSKAHSREAVSSRESVSKPSYTSDTTDLSNTQVDQEPKKPKSRSASGPAPPSPPLSRVEKPLRKAASGASMRRSAEEAMQDYMPSNIPTRGLRPGTTLRHAEEGRSASSTRNTTLKDQKMDATPPRNSSSRVAKASTSQNSLRGRKASGAETTLTTSDVTSVAPSRRAPQQKAPILEHNSTSSPPSESESSPPTPKGTEQPYSSFQDRKIQAPVGMPYPKNVQKSDEGDTLIGQQPPPPPPPPALTTNPGDAPRVDYLLQNGGLPQPVQRIFSSAARPPLTHPSQQYTPHSVQLNKAADIEETFAPFSKLLDNFNVVIAKHGSVAVATGYKSVARRLLDRLETVFARNISCERCPCALCRSSPTNGTYLTSDEDNGVSWGEVLELVSGRKELPQWPPFILPTSENGFGSSQIETGIEAPMQKLDIDVPEEYREHYVRQSQKTKQSVQKWLASQPEEQATPPREVDDETLTFAMLTYLEPNERRIFTALMKGLSTVPESRAPTPAPTEPKTDFMVRIGTALQRLYRLPKTPREPECAMYLLKNPSIHAALATLSAINASEWEVLVSGRFDGFLWSGAEDGNPSESRLTSRGPSRTGTPYGGTAGLPISRGSTPFGGGPMRTATPAAAGPGPVAFDEETEIAVLAEVEREIYLGMEALEDAFESLHVKAETVRRALRERSTGLALQAQSRRGQSEIGVRMGTPASASGWAHESFEELPSGGSETEDFLSDLRSELAPDDSASNIGWREHGRRKERKKKREEKSGRMRTPAVPEEDEENSDPAPRRRRY